ncbi:MAG TPA: ATP synthase F1 subunit delta [Candidatus Omnitrophota bacterium]|nr:ATP synthase F1 subunit delta [Candidatus Omnitrophota bacterium]HPN88564.1 ATP synthase F1 subunit delta [Candidatus Omnitrophota bacterium]
MKSSIISKRYADAFIGLARTTIGLETALKETKLLRRLIKENAEFENFLKSPQISPVEKNRFIDDILKNSFSPDVCNFLKLLIEKNRIEYFIDIADYLRLTYEHEDTVNVVLKTTFFLDDDLIQKIERKLQEKLGKKMQFYIDLDTDLCGGIQVIIENKIIDGSIKHRLNEVKKKLRAIEVF